MVSVRTDAARYYADLCDEIRLFFNERNIPETQETANDGLTVSHSLSHEGKEIINTAEIYESGKLISSYTYKGKIKDGISDLELKRAEKHGAKIAVYRVLSAYTGEEKSWGSLTGVRPTKMFRDLAERIGYEETVRLMKDEYDVTAEKRALLEQIYHVQRPYLENIDLKKDIDIYIGVPFCMSRCFYCSFFSLLASKNGEKEHSYVDALIKELKYAESFLKGRKIRSVYMGGGTPTALSAQELERILSYIDRYTKDTEFTVEAGRPDTITDEKLRLLKEHNVDRISINPQTTCEKTLQMIGRKHTVQQIKDAFDMAGRYSFDSINMDLIAGLPEEDPEIFTRSLEDCMAFGPENITVHTLAIKKGSKYGMENFTGTVSEKDVSKMVDLARKALGEKGYSPYYLYKQKYMTGNLENVGYALEGKECIYNINMMEDETNVIAFGLGTSSRRVYGYEGRIKRYYTTKDMNMYLENIDDIAKNKVDLFLAST